MGKEERDKGHTSYNCCSGWLDSPEEFEQLEPEARLWVRGFVWRNRWRLLRFLSMHHHMHRQSSNNQ